MTPRRGSLMVDKVWNCIQSLTSVLWMCTIYDSIHLVLLQQSSMGGGGYILDSPCLPVCPSIDIINLKYIFNTDVKVLLKLCISYIVYIYIDNQVVHLLFDWHIGHLSLSGDLSLLFCVHCHALTIEFSVVFLDNYHSNSFQIQYEASLKWGGYKLWFSGLHPSTLGTEQKLKKIDQFEKQIYL